MSKMAEGNSREKSNAQGNGKKVSSAEESYRGDVKTYDMPVTVRAFRKLYGKHIDSLGGWLGMLEIFIEEFEQDFPKKLPDACNHPVYRFLDEQVSKRVNGHTDPLQFERYEKICDKVDEWAEESIYSDLVLVSGRRKLDSKMGKNMSVEESNLKYRDGMTVSFPDEFLVDVRHDSERGMDDFFGC